MKKNLPVLFLALFFSSTALAQAYPIDTGSVSRLATENYMGITDNRTYDVSFRQASLRESLQFLSWIAAVNIMMPEGTEGTVNVSFKNITIADAINAIVKANQLEYALEGTVIRIGKSEQFKDAGEDLKTETIRLRYAPAAEMAEKVKTLLSGRGSAINDARTNSLIVRELPANIENIRRFVADVDIKDAQVLIESKILEATRTFSRNIGIQWGANRGQDGWDFRFGGLNAVGQADSGRNLNVNLPAGTPTSGLLLGALFKQVNLDVQITAAEQRGDVYVISDPSIVTSNGKTANIRSGATLLVQGSSTVNIGTSSGGGTSAGSGLQEIETGVELKVTPQITINDFVKLDIETTTSTPDFSRAVQGVPIIVDNTAKTTVLVKDGETTVIGGLSRYSDNLTRKDVPYLSKVPLFGNLFKSKLRSKENGELMVFIRPTIIRVEGQEPAQVRVKEVEERKQAMYLDPVIDPQKDAEKEARKEVVLEKIKQRGKYKRGNKYIQQ